MESDISHKILRKRFPNLGENALSWMIFSGSHAIVPKSQHAGTDGALILCKFQILQEDAQFLIFAHAGNGFDHCNTWKRGKLSEDGQLSD